MKYFSLIHKEEIHPAEDEKLIPAKEFSTLLNAKEVLEKAKEDAKLFYEETEEECKKLREKAHEEGFQEGLEKFNEHLLFFDSEIKKVRHEAQQAILSLALKAAKKIVAKELETHPETIVDIVLQAIVPLTQHHRVKIYVSKGEKELVEANRERIRAAFQHLDSLVIQERADVPSGGCIIETEAGIINATMENQWRALESAFEKYMKR